MSLCFAKYSSEIKLIYSGKLQLYYKTTPNKFISFACGGIQTLDSRIMGQMFYHCATWVQQRYV